MWRPFNVLIRDVTCRTISTDDGNLNCCFVSQRRGTGLGERRGEGEREWRVPQGPGAHTCINMYERRTWAECDISYARSMQRSSTLQDDSERFAVVEAISRQLFRGVLDFSSPRPLSSRETTRHFLAFENEEEKLIIVNRLVKNFERALTSFIR